MVCNKTFPYFRLYRKHISSEGHAHEREDEEAERALGLRGVEEKVGRRMRLRSGKEVEIPQKEDDEEDDEQEGNRRSINNAQSKVHYSSKQYQNAIGSFGKDGQRDANPAMSLHGSNHQQISTKTLIPQPKYLSRQPQQSERAYPLPMRRESTLEEGDIRELTQDGNNLEQGKSRAVDGAVQEDPQSAIDALKELLRPKQHRPSYYARRQALRATFEENEEASGEEGEIREPSLDAEKSEEQGKVRPVDKGIQEDAIDGLKELLRSKRLLPSFYARRQAPRASPWEDEEEFDESDRSHEAQHLPNNTSAPAPSKAPTIIPPEISPIVENQHEKTTSPPTAPLQNKRPRAAATGDDERQPSKKLLKSTFQFTPATPLAPAFQAIDDKRLSVSLPTALASQRQTDTTSERDFGTITCSEEENPERLEDRKYAEGAAPPALAQSDGRAESEGEGGSGSGHASRQVGQERGS